MCLIFLEKGQALKKTVDSGRTLESFRRESSSRFSPSIADSRRDAVSGLKNTAEWKIGNFII